MNLKTANSMDLKSFNRLIKKTPNTTLLILLVKIINVSFFYLYQSFSTNILPLHAI